VRGVDSLGTNEEDKKKVRLRGRRSYTEKLDQERRREEKSGRGEGLQGPGLFKEILNGQRKGKLRRCPRRDEGATGKDPNLVDTAKAGLSKKGLWKRQRCLEQVGPKYSYVL